MNNKSNGEVFHAALSFLDVGIDLENKIFLQQLARSIINSFELTIVDEYWHQYDPIGLTGVYVLEQSSLTLHTWSEFNKLVIDITTCGKRVDIHRISTDLQERLLSRKVKSSVEIL